MEVNGQLHSPAALLAERTPVHIGWESGWAPEPVWTRWRRKENSCPCQEYNSSRPTRGRVTIL